MTSFKEFLAEAAKAPTWSELVKKYGMVNGKRYHDTGTIPKLIKNKQGIDLVQIDKEDGNEFRVEADKLATGNKRVVKTLKGTVAVDEFLATLKLDAGVDRADDAAICKFIKQTYQAPVKDVDDLKRNWTFIKWPNAIELKDNEQSLYVTLVDGNNPGDDEEGLAPIGMTVVELEQWLLEKGVKKVAKPKRTYGGSLYD